MVSDIIYTDLMNRNRITTFRVKSCLSEQKKGLPIITRVIEITREKAVFNSETNFVDNNCFLQFLEEYNIKC